MRSQPSQPLIGIVAPCGSPQGRQRVTDQFPEVRQALARLRGAKAQGRPCTPGRREAPIGARSSVNAQCLQSVNDGGAAVRVALTNRRIRAEQSLRVAEAWIAMQQDARADHHNHPSLELSRQELAANRRTARYTLYAVLTTMAAAIVAAVAY